MGKLEGKIALITLGEGETFTTLELKINFLKPVWQARLQAIGRVVTHDRTVGLVECDIATVAAFHRYRHRTTTPVL